jgi:hypothetical protein
MSSCSGRWIGVRSRPSLANYDNEWMPNVDGFAKESRDTWRKVHKAKRHRDIQGVCISCTRWRWGTEGVVVLPHVRGSVGGGAVLAAFGLLSDVRGYNCSTLDASDNTISVRPDFLVIDDPQTDGSAKSVTQADDRAEAQQAEGCRRANDDA